MSKIASGMVGAISGVVGVVTGGTVKQTNVRLDTTALGSTQKSGQLDVFEVTGHAVALLPIGTGSGIGQTTSFSNVPLEITESTGQTISGLFDITDVTVVIAREKETVVTFAFASNLVYPES